MPSGSEWNIARVSVADIAELIRLGEEAKLSPWSAQNYVDELKLENAILLKLVNEDRRISGFIVGRVVIDGSEHRDAEIYNIAVVDSEKRRGLGQVLFDAFLEEAVHKGAAAVWLEVRESNEPARSFYRKNGFVFVQTRPNFYRDPVENAILMRLDLLNAVS